MNLLGQPLKRTFVAFAVRVSRNPMYRLRHPQRAATRLLSTFQPADPPGTFGTPVFPDIDFAIATDPSSEAAIRNSDPGAIFVVTGASRGIGLQFCKSLIERTKVREVSLTLSCEQTLSQKMCVLLCVLLI
jgi:hypothetical protein